MSRSERLEARIEELEQEVLKLATLLKQSIDARENLEASLQEEVSRLSRNELVLATALEEQDNVIAAIRAALTESKTLSDRGFSDKLKEIQQMRQRARQSAKERADLADVQHKAAQAAKTQAGHPPEAFIFGG
jgi:predicted RNase H-like nuclease (RuvC/YqgF family)